MSDLQHVSTFSGVGGIDLAFERAGVPTIATAEFDKHARGVLADRYPDAHQFHDVKDVTADALHGLGLDPRRTVLSGGFPCQDLSVAGARRGLGEGTRSGLYWELDRIMAEFRPAWVVLENVPGLLSACCACPGDGTCTERDLARSCAGESHSVTGGACWGQCIARHGGVMGAVLGSLAERGYGFAYRVLDAQHFGVPQRRRRVVIVGRLGDSGAAPAQVLLEPESVPGNPCAGIAPRPIFAASSARGVDSGRAVGVRGDVAHTLTAEGHDASEDGTGRGTPVVAFHHQQDPISGDRSPALGAKSNGMGVSYVADTASTLQAAGGDRGYRIDAEAEAGGHLIAHETFQKVTRPASNQHPDVWEARDVAATLSPFDLGSDGRAVELVLAPTLTASLGEGGWAGHNRKDEMVERTFEAGATVRRLTPTECERLQGFPDGHTATSNGKPQSDAQRYKQLGNAVAVPVFTWVAERVVAADRALDRFWSKVEVHVDGCWLWTGAISDGYGAYRGDDGSTKRAHRYAYECEFGAVPDGKELDHTCRNKRCVRPDHLEPVTHQENIARHFAEVTHCPRGHEYDEANTYLRKGRRHCRACNRERQRERNAS